MAVWTVPGPQSSMNPPSSWCTTIPAHALWRLNDGAPVPQKVVCIRDIPLYVMAVLSYNCVWYQAGQRKGDSPPNVRFEPLPEAGATQERTLEAVGWKPVLAGRCSGLACLEECQIFVKIIFAKPAWPIV
jgi:hypothetical protein